MLVARKGTKNKRAVVDFRLLNTRILKRNTATPLLRDIFKILGRSRCEVLPCVDLKDAFHSLGLTDFAKEFCCILPYFGSAHYRYEVLPMVLSISPQVWITYIENLLEGIPNRQSYMDEFNAAWTEQLLVASHFTWFKTFPQKAWIAYIENLLEGIPNRQSYIAIMDDLLLHGLSSCW